MTINTDPVQDNVLQVIKDLRRRIEILEQKELKVNDLSNVSNDLGDQVGGRILIHKDPENPKDPADGDYDGVILGYMTIDGTAYAIIGLADGVLQFAADPETGELIAGAGAVILNAAGITAIAGTIAGWEISETQIKKGGIILDSANEIIYVGSGVSKIVVDGVNSLLKSGNFVSGSKGFQLNGLTGNVECNDIVARGALRSSVFVTDEVSATAGTQGIYKSAGVLKSDVTTVASPTTFNVDINDPDSGHTALFEADDILRLKSATGDCWVSVSSVSDQTTFYRYVCVLESGSAATFTAGQAVIDYGQSGDGYIELSAAGTDVPLITLYTHSGSPWTDARVVLKLGNLGSEYGLAGYDAALLEQFKIDNSGQGSFCNGNAVINADGITGTDLLKWMIRQTAITESYTRIGKLGLAFSGDGGTIPIWQMSLESDYGAEQVLNGGFETGDLTNWTDADSQYTVFSSASAKDGSYVVRTEAYAIEGEFAPLSISLVSDKFSVSGGNYFSGYFFVYGDSATTGHPNSVELIVKFYTAGDALVSTETVGILYGTENDFSWKELSEAIDTPPAATKAEITIKFNTWDAIYADSPYVWVDAISCKPVTANQKLWLEDGGVGASGVTDDTASALSSGTYTPTLDSTNSVNVDSVTFSAAQWVRVGNVVSVSGYGLFNATANTQTNILFDPPIASAFTDASDAAGNAKITTTVEPGAVYANATYDELEINFKVTGTTSEQPFTYQFMYKIK